MPVRLNGATELTYRPSWRDSPSFSPPTAWKSEIWFDTDVQVVGMPSRNIRTVNGSGAVPSWASPVPMMSLLNMPWTSLPAAAICWAMNVEPNRPSSSPDTAAKTIVPGNWWVANSRASSSTHATPDPSSSAPGASSVEFSMSVTRESRGSYSAPVRALRAELGEEPLDRGEAHAGLPECLQVPQPGQRDRLSVGHGSGRG